MMNFTISNSLFCNLGPGLCKNGREKGCITILGHGHELEIFPEILEELFARIISGGCFCRVLLQVTITKSIFLSLNFTYWYCEKLLFLSKILGLQLVNLLKKTLLWVLPWKQCLIFQNSFPEEGLGTTSEFWRYLKEYIWMTTSAPGFGHELWFLLQCAKYARIRVSSD